MAPSDSASDLERHEDGVRIPVRAEVVAPAEAFPLEAEGFVEGDRSLVPRKDVQLELRHAVLRRPRDGSLEQGSADAAPAETLVDHQPEIGDVVGRRVLVARERETSRELAVELR